MYIYIVVINFLLNLFFQILYMSIIATVISGVVLLLKKFLKGKMSPSASYMIWLVFLTALIFPISIPSKVSIYNYIDISNIKYVEYSKTDNFINDFKQSTNSEMQENANNYIYEVNQGISFCYIKILFAFIWFIIFVQKLIKRMSSYKNLSKYAGNNEIEDERIILIFESCRKKLKIKKHIKIISQDFVRSPCTIGVFNVKILITNKFLVLDDIALSDIFMHELSHYKRKDNVVNFIILILKSVYWFNPLFKRIFKMIRNDMELATDEMATKNIDIEGLRTYCKLMVAIGGMSNIKDEQLLGLASNSKMIEKRIDMISLQDEFKKNSKWIVLSTILIIIFMIFVFYPTSYGISNVPELYLKLENGDIIEVTNTEENCKLNEITLTTNSKTEFVVKNGKANTYIFYSRENLNDETLNDKISQISRKILRFETGEYIYRFALTYGNNQNNNYAIKINVE